MRKRKELKRDMGISKEEALRELIMRGYDARHENNLIRVYVDENSYLDTIREVLKVYKEIGYRRDCGFAKKRQAV